VPVVACPKRMRYGPCGGVRPDSTCELGDRPCVFVGGPPPVWDEADRPHRVAAEPLASTMLATAARRPVVLTDLTVLPYDRESVRSTVAALAGSCDAVLVGEHQNRPDLPPTLLAAEVLAAGGRPWATLACRDRNRVVLEQELVGLRAVGVDGVLCVTGDARGQGVRAGATQVFDLDGTRLAALAHGCGLPVAVPESPQSPPVDERPARVVTKQAAGADVCVLNHVGSPERVAQFVAAARSSGATVPFVAGVAVYSDDRSAAVLDRFPGLSLDPSTVASVVGSPDPVAAGVEAAVAEARALLSIDGVVGVNLSGLASADGVAAGAAVKAAIGARILEEHS